jgi:hypothetical protein
MNFAGVLARAAAAVVIGGWSISPSRRGGQQNPSYFSVTTSCHASADPKPIQPPSARGERGTASRQVGVGVLGGSLGEVTGPST